MPWIPDIKRDLENIAKVAASDKRRAKLERLDRFAIAALALTGEADMAHAKSGVGIFDRAEWAYGMALALETERVLVMKKLEDDRD